MGRSDILMFPLRPEKDFGIIIEFKRCENKKDLNKMAEKAQQQITEKDYATELQSARAQKIMSIGIAFCGKSVEIALNHN
jgi:PleD family two-component response regulator